MQRSGECGSISAKLTAIYSSPPFGKGGDGKETFS